MFVQTWLINPLPYDWTFVVGRSKAGATDGQLLIHFCKQVPLYIYSLTLWPVLPSDLFTTCPSIYCLNKTAITPPVIALLGILSNYMFMPGARLSTYILRKLVIIGSELRF